MSDSGVDHRPEVVIALTQPLWIVAKIARRDVGGDVAGYVVAMGWDRPQDTTFYLVSDEKLARPIWVPEQDVISNSVKPFG